ncbi:hypothetical protein NDU88_003218 [Pleurodeles waltl]|uniref:Uncharacterized protein n=1 Tax=Pleurodeles waltl TaxID=8319 RepID=A0AAV7UFH9_PLEWA|nr:hypothetical protein NDU88_003218 [Pleurodeles waltl]
MNRQDCQTGMSLRKEFGELRVNEGAGRSLRHNKKLPERRGQRKEPEEESEVKLDVGKRSRVNARYVGTLKQLKSPETEDAK